MSLIGLHHIHLRVRDLEATRSFSRDFGLVDAGEQDGLIYMRDSGSGVYSLVLEAAAESTLVGIAFEVDGEDDLTSAIANHGAGAPYALAGLAGGTAVDMTDPEGLVVTLVSGVSKRTKDPLPPSMILNQGDDKTRRGVWQHKPPLAPPPLLRLGHVGLFIRDWRACDRWYRNVLGLIPSDVLYAGHEDNVIGGFYRVDRGEEWVDHHTIAFFQMGRSDLHHISFEVQNPEAQFMAHRWMTQRQHDSIWGVGRHPLGSHVFDVWRDPSGYRFETFSDTDLCNTSSPSSRHPVAEAQMDLWTDRHVDAYFN